MGMPSINITFRESASTVKTRKRGIVGLILKDTVPAKNPVVVSTEADIDALTNISADNIKQLKLAILGADTAPKKVVAFFVATAATDYATALSYFESNQVNYLAIPTVETDEKADSIKTWIAAQRAEGIYTKVVMPNVAADDMAVENYATPSVTDSEGKTYTAEQFCARIAGILASTPLTGSCTFATIPELTACTKLSKADMDAAIDAGKLIIFWDGEKCKIARGVTSLTTITDTIAAYRKIRVVDIVDTIASDIKKLCEDTYIGKFTNSYDNKMVLIGAIGDYLAEMQNQQILASYSVDLDIDAIKKALNDPIDMTDTEIRQALTGDTVYITASIKIINEIESIVLPITV